MSSLLERFITYVKVDTQSDDNSPSYPSTEKQFDLGKILRDECNEMGLSDVELNEFGIVTATVPATEGCTAPAIVWVAHIDTSPETSGTNVKPIVHENYQLGDITLPGNPTHVIKVEEEVALKDCVGKTIITSDGTTLLGSDDKSGIAVIMTAAAELMASREIAHGPIRLCFTCDEEIGRGIDKLDIEKLNAVAGYTLDGDSEGKIDSETFSADQATITVTGVNTHPSVGKDVMVNAIRILSQFIANLPTETLAPEVTEDRDGFLHPYIIEGGVASAMAKILLRDFEDEKLKEYAQLLEEIAKPMREAHPNASIDIKIKEQYRNMREYLKNEPRALAKAIEATKAAGMEPIHSVIRGGTDGSILSERGLPTPNLSTGEHNPHSPCEWTCLEEMESAVKVLVELAKEWGKETA
jgi:tripeptide aminopeptidase